MSEAYRPRYSYVHQYAVHGCYVYQMHKALARSICDLG